LIQRNQFHEPKTHHLFLAVIGFIAPYYFFISFLLAHGFDARLFVRQLFASRISTFFAVDLLLSCVVFVRYFGQEASRYAMKHQWVYLIALLTVGLSFALPLFLFARESHLETRPRVSESV
jgi:Terpene cyclase DEP1